MGESLRFGRERPPPASPRQAMGLVVLLVAAGTALAWTRAWWSPGAAPVGPIVEVRGDVPRPGAYVVSPPTVHGSLRAAGGSVDGVPDRALAPGDTVVVTGGAVEVRPAENPLLVGLPIDPNTADAAALDTIPGVSTGLAEALVAERAAHGPYRSFEALTRAPGVTPAVLEGLRPFLAVRDPGPIDLNRASAGELETLPGIGPALARRIVEDRLANGPFTTPAELARVDGVPASVVATVAPLVRCGDAP